LCHRLDLLEVLAPPGEFVTHPYTTPDFWGMAQFYMKYASLSNFIMLISCFFCPGFPGFFVSIPLLDSERQSGKSPE
jgi:hypothetical protein